MLPLPTLHSKEEGCVLARSGPATHQVVAVRMSAADTLPGQRLSHSALMSSNSRNTSGRMCLLLSDNFSTWVLGAPPSSHRSSRTEASQPCGRGTGREKGDSRVQEGRVRGAYAHQQKEGAGERGQCGVHITHSKRHMVPEPQTMRWCDGTSSTAQLTHACTSKLSGGSD
jgi:hypothetical protein